MQITQIIPKVARIIIYLICGWFIYNMAEGIDDGKLKAVYIPIALSLLIWLPYVVDKIGAFPLFCGVIFIYWLPLNSGLVHVASFLDFMWATEVGMWVLCLGVLIHGFVTKSAQIYYTIKYFPFMPFVMLVAGSVTANLVSGNLFAEAELANVRVFCFLTAVTCFLCIYFIKTTKQAEHLVWIYLISAGLLGLIFLFMPDNSYFTMQFSQETGRLMKLFNVPLLGTMYMSAESTPECFTFVVALSFGLWLHHPSFRLRLTAAAILALSALVIMQGQARSALIGTICSIIVIQALSLRFNTPSPKSPLRSLLKPAILIFILIFYFWYNASTSTNEIFQRRGQSIFTGLHDASVEYGRVGRWQTAFDVAIKNPFGVGIFGFPYENGASWVAHNLLLYVWLSFGIIGLIAFLWFFLLYTKACWSGLHSNNPGRRLLCITGIAYATSLFITGIGSPIYGDQWQTLMVWIPIGISFAVAKLPETNMP